MGKIFRDKFVTASPPPPEEQLPERPSLAEYIYAVASGDTWSWTNPYMTGSPVSVFRTLSSATEKARKDDVILICQVIRRERRRVVEFNEAMREPDEP